MEASQGFTKIAGNFFRYSIIDRIVNSTARIIVYELVPCLMV